MDNTIMAHTSILESYLSIAYGWKIGFIGFALPIQYIYYSIIIFALSGSPAEKADLEVADEILEINGQSLDNSNHTDVIAHIHNVRNRNTLKILARKFSNLSWVPNSVSKGFDTAMKTGPSDN